jgi:hypothetical protein
LVRGKFWVILARKGFWRVKVMEGRGVVFMGI